MQYFVYIVTTNTNTNLYTGITSDLPRRAHEHKNSLIEGYSKQHATTKLIYAEAFSDVNEAIHREKCIKRWKRSWKIELIEKSNPEWLEISPY